MASLFTKIINGDIPCHKVYENENFLAFLDINPLQEGHTLVVPKVEQNKLFDLENDVLAELLPFAKEVARKIERSFPCDRVGVAVIGLEIPHAHVHLIPINSERDMDFSKKKLTLTQERLAAIAEKLRNV